MAIHKSWVLVAVLGLLGVGCAIDDQSSAQPRATAFGTTTSTVDTGQVGPKQREQPQQSNGWRLLLDDTVGWPYEVNVAQTSTQLALLWGHLEQREPPPRIDFEEEVVIHFGEAVSGSCPEILMEDIAVDVERGVVYPVHGSPWVNPEQEPRACTGDARPHAFVVAVERSQLKRSVLTIQLSDRIDARHADSERLMEVDLDSGTQSRQLVPTVPWAEAATLEFPYSASLVGELRYDAEQGCPWLETEGGPRSVVWPAFTTLSPDPLTINQYERSIGTKIRLTGGRALDDSVASVCTIGDWTWIATEIYGALEEPARPPREYTEPKWDPYYTPVVFTTGEFEVEIDRWPWALLSDSGWTTIRRNGEIVVEAPTEWMGGGGTFTNPYTGEIVVELENMGEQIGEYVAELEASQSEG